MSGSGVCEIKYHLKETQQHLSAPPPMKSKLQRKYHKLFCAWMVLYFTRLSTNRNTLSTLTYLGAAADRCSWTSLRWYFISQTPVPNKAQNQQKTNRCLTGGTMVFALHDVLDGVRFAPKFTLQAVWPCQERARSDALHRRRLIRTSNHMAN